MVSTAFSCKPSGICVLNCANLAGFGDDYHIWGVRGRVVVLVPEAFAESLRMPVSLITPMVLPLKGVQKRIKKCIVLKRPYRRQWTYFPQSTANLCLLGGPVITQGVGVPKLSCTPGTCANNRPAKLSGRFDWAGDARWSNLSYNISASFSGLKHILRPVWRYKINAHFKEEAKINGLPIGRRASPALGMGRMGMEGMGMRRKRAALGYCQILVECLTSLCTPASRYALEPLAGAKIYVCSKI